MNILLLTYQGELAGSTFSVFYLADGLAKRGHTVVVGCPSYTMLYRMLQDSPAIAAHIDFKSKLDSSSMKQIRDLVHQYDIELMNAQASYDRYLAIFANWRYKLNIPVIHTRRQDPKSAGGWIQRQFYVKNTAKIVVISHGLKDIFIKKGFPTKHLEVIHNGMHPSFFEGHEPEKTTALKEKYGFDGTNRIIGCVSRPKRQHELIQALPQLPKDIKLMLVGPTAEDYDFGKLADSIGVSDRIIFTGNIPREEVVNYYPLFDVFCLPSHMDGFGLVLIEAMGMGIPVVATRFGGIIDVLDEQRNGLWYELGDIDGLARQLNRVLEDEELKSTLIANGKHAAKKVFSIEATISGYERFYQRIISQ